VTRYDVATAFFNDLGQCDVIAIVLLHDVGDTPAIGNKEAVNGAIEDDGRICQVAARCIGVASVEEDGTPVRRYRNRLRRSS
jgi:hypothetical protein